MPYCPNCSTTAQSADAYCHSCGTALGGAGSSDSVQTLPFRISLKRVMLMTVLSYGLYLFYWFYLTWEQYRDHTSANVRPVWHALGFLIPIYGWVRVHIHLRSFKELMAKGGLQQTTLNEGWVLGLVALSSMLEWQSFKLSFAELTLEDSISIVVLDSLSLTVVAGMLLYLQGNINKYWMGLANVRVTNARIGVGEVVLAVVGTLIWLTSITTLASFYTDTVPISYLSV